MQDIIQKVLRKIELMSDEDFASKLAQYRDHEVAATLRHIQDTVSAHEASLTIVLEKFFEIVPIESPLNVSDEDFENFEAYAILACAANDERFCLAA